MKKLVIENKDTLATLIFLLFLGKEENHYSIEDLTAFIYYSLMKGFISQKAFFSNKTESNKFDFLAFINQYDQKDYEKFTKAIKESDNEKALKEAAEEYVGKTMKDALELFTFKEENYLKELLAFRVIIKDILSTLKTL